MNKDYPRRKIAILVGVILLLVSHLLVFLLDDNKHWHGSWPILYYSMYSKIYHPTVSKRVQVAGVIAKTGDEIILNDSNYIQPFTGRHIERALKKYSKELYSTLAEDLLEKYKRRKQRGFHQGPEIRQVRLYFVEWDLQSVIRREPKQLSRNLIAESTYVEEH